jgi:hypothetical protein
MSKDFVSVGPHRRAFPKRKFADGGTSAADRDIDPGTMEVLPYYGKGPETMETLPYYGKEPETMELLPNPPKAQPVTPASPEAPEAIPQPAPENTLPTSPAVKPRLPPKPTSSSSNDTSAWLRALSGAALGGGLGVGALSGAALGLLLPLIWKNKKQQTTTTDTNKAAKGGPIGASMAGKRTMKFQAGGITPIDNPDIGASLSGMQRNLGIAPGGKLPPPSKDDLFRMGLPSVDAYNKLISGASTDFGGPMSTAPGLRGTTESMARLMGNDPATGRQLPGVGRGAMAGGPPQGMGPGAGAANSITPLSGGAPGSDLNRQAMIAAGPPPGGPQSQLARMGPMGGPPAGMGPMGTLSAAGMGPMGPPPGMVGMGPMGPPAGGRAGMGPMGVPPPGGMGPMGGPPPGGMAGLGAPVGAAAGGPPGGMAGMGPMGVPPMGVPPPGGMPGMGAPGQGLPPEMIAALLQRIQAGGLGPGSPQSQFQGMGLPPGGLPPVGAADGGPVNYRKGGAVFGNESQSAEDLPPAPVKKGRPVFTRKPKGPAISIAIASKKPVVPTPSPYDSEPAPPPMAKGGEIAAKAKAKGGEIKKAKGGECDDKMAKGGPAIKKAKGGVTKLAAGGAAKQRRNFPNTQSPPPKRLAAGGKVRGCGAAIKGCTFSGCF